MAQTSPRDNIPQPKAHFLRGNAPDIDRNAPIQSLMRLARKLGPIYRLALPGRRLIVLSGFELVNEVCDDSRFDKRVTGAVAKLRAVGGDGLLTARTEEPNWRKAHAILASAFSFQSMHAYFPIMTEIAEHLVRKWEERGPRGVDVAADMTRLTLETIAKCGFNYGFDSFSREDDHPFIAAMVRCLREGMQRARRLWIEEWLAVRSHREFTRDSRFLFETVDAVVKSRRQAGPGSGPPDLLELMLHGIDKTTGESLDDVNIRHQIITFLIAGHETTSGLLSFALYFLLGNPAVLAKTLAEVRSVLPPGSPGLTEFAQVSRLRYVSQVLRETLRLWPTAPAFARYAREDTMIGGRYAVTTADTLLVLSPILHRDPATWGSRPEEFDPDRFEPDAERKRPANSYLPFGVGQRSCIGRFFALQEATLVLATVLHRLSLSADPGYRLNVRETITLKPAGFVIRASGNAAGAAHAAAPATAAPAAAAVGGPKETPAVVRADGHGTRLLVLYGSNMGTSEELARQLAREGDSNGFTVEVEPLDDCPARLQQPGIVLVVASSYNGSPPDNARRFSSRLAESTDGFSGVRYAVFGCGHHDWVSTFQAFPTFVDDRLAALGGTRVLDKGSGDSGGDLYGDFRVWRRMLWEKIAPELGAPVAAKARKAHEPLYQVQVVNEQQPNPFVVSFGARPMVIVENRELHRDGNGGGGPSRSTRHIEVALPVDLGYRPGDHLGVIARNSRELVRRVLGRFALEEDTIIRLDSRGKDRSNLPTGRPVSVTTLLGEYVELQDAATQDQVAVVAEYTQSPSDRLQLTALCGDDDDSRRRYQEEIFRPRVSLLELLEDNPSCPVPFGVFLEMLAPLRPRYYSISSSPMHYRGICSITVGVLDEPARSGRGRFHGVCSNFLHDKPKGSVVHAFVRDPGSPFRPPRNPRTPIVMVGAGTGVAPFIGFLQERAELKRQGSSVGPSLLFFGCRSPDADFYYREELAEYEREGVVELVCAFSRADPTRKSYVQDRIREQSQRLWQLIQDGAVIYVCGDASRIAPAVRAAVGEIYQLHAGADEARREQWLNEMVSRQRYLADVWASA